MVASQISSSLPFNMRHLCGETLLVLLLILFAGISSALKTSPAAPSAAFLQNPSRPNGRWLIAWRANDPSERILLASSLDGDNFEATQAPFGYSQKTFTTPAVFYFTSPLDANPKTYLFWVGTGWSTPGPINTVDTTSDTPWAVSTAMQFNTPSGFICVYFRGNTNNNIYYTCSTTGLLGSFPKATQVTGQTTFSGPTADNRISARLNPNRSYISFRAADPSGRIFVIQADANQNVIPSTLVQPFCCTSWSPVLRYTDQPGTGNTLIHVVWTDSSSRRLFFGVSVDNGFNWSSALPINSVDTSKDQPAYVTGYTLDGRRRACVYFISNDSSNTIRVTCSFSGFPGSWPSSVPV